MAKIKKDDLVQVIAGRDKGLQGRVLSVDSDNDRVIVEGVMRVKKHVKVGQTSRGATTGGIETVEAAITSRTWPLWVLIRSRFAGFARLRLSATVVRRSFVSALAAAVEGDRAVSAPV